MIVDTSALVAILRGEPDANRYIDVLAGSERTAVSAPTWVETGVVVDANGDPVLSRRLDALRREADIAIFPFTAEHAAIARQAYREFGRGSGHPAKLNLGDCFSYALATATGEPLLYKGDDFGFTDVASALP